MIVRRFRRPRRPLGAHGWALLAVLLAALAARLFGLNWDDGRDLHPDELYIAKIVLIDRIRVDWPPDWGQMLDPARSGLNPRSVDPATGEFRDFPYGALPLLVTDAAAAALSAVTGLNWNAPERAYLVGRFLSALLDTGTVFVTFLLGSRLVSATVGLVAAVVAAAAPMMIQLAHFFTTDSWLAFFVAVALLGAVRGAETGSLRVFGVAGFAFGLAMATKGSVFALAVPLVAAVMIAVRPRADQRSDADLVRGVVGRLAVVGVAALVGFALFEPFALVRPEVYVESLRNQAEMARGALDMPYTRQYVGLTPGLYQIEQFARWGYGPVAALLAIAGLVVLARRLVIGRRLVLAVPLLWVLAYGIVVSASEMRFLRYLAPLSPVLAVAAGVALCAVAAAVRARGGPRWSGALVAAALLAVVGWGAAFVHVYAAENPRLSASRWIYANVPDGSSLSAEYWDDALPRDLSPGLTARDHQYATVVFDNLADRPPDVVADDVFRLLRAVDYVVLSSNRAEVAVDRAPWRYPVQRRVFDLLRDGALGFDLAAEFRQAPRLGPLVFDDRAADESFINYDHPAVEIYAKREPIPRPAFDAVVAEAVRAPWSPTRQPPSRSLLLDQPVGSLPIVADARWSEAVTESTAGAMVAWVALLVVLRVAGAPLAGVLFPAFADRGGGLARLVALLLAGYAVWLGASLRAFSFRAVWCAVAVAGVALVGVLLARRFRLAPAWTPIAVRTTVVGEVVFWAAFALFLAFRFVNPDGWHPIWGGEKPMEFAHLNATLRSAHFPPFDPWYSGGVLNYYYYGLYLVAFLLKLTGIPSEIGFNLAQPTVMALLAAAVFSVAATLGADLSRVRRLAVPAGLVGVLVVVGMGNLTTAVKLVGGVVEGTRIDAGSFADWVWDGSRAIPPNITEFPFFTGLYADLHAHVVALPITTITIALCYALVSSRVSIVSPDGSPLAAADRVRFVAMLALLAVCLGSLAAANAWDVPTYAALALASIASMWALARSLPCQALACAAASVGLIGGAYLLFLPFHNQFVALFGSLARVREPTDLGAVLSHLGGLLAIVAVGLVVGAVAGMRAGEPPLAQPVWWLAAGATVALAVLTGIVTGRAWLDGAAAAAAVAVLLALLTMAAVWSTRTTRLGSGWVLAAKPLAVAIFVASGVAFVLGWLACALFLALGGAAAAVWMTVSRPAPRFVALLVAAAAFVGAGVELVVVADDLAGTDWYRMNTVFKFYNQLWLLFGLAAAGYVGLMLRASGLLRRRMAAAAIAVHAFAAAGYAADSVPGQASAAETPTTAHRTASAAQGWSRVGLALTAVVAVASLAYPAMAIGPRLAQRFAGTQPFATLDALAWMEHGSVPLRGGGDAGQLSFAGDRAAIDWLNRNVPGSPVIAEASIGPYRCNGSRISIATGLPTIIGWERHQRQQRYGETLGQRVADVRRLYASTDVDEKLALLRRYDVRYVVVGDLERAYPAIVGNDCVFGSDPAGVAAFDRMVGTSLDIAFADGGTTIYAVRPATIDTPS